jgi:hypothetical protein
MPLPPPKTNVLVLLVFFFSESVIGSCCFPTPFPYSLEHYAVRPKDLFELLNNFEAPVCGTV